MAMTSTAENGYRYREEHRRRTVRSTQTITKQRQSGVTAKDRMKIMLAVFIIALMGLAFIISTAYAASVNYTNNQLRTSNTELKGEVQTLEIQLESIMNVPAVKETATRELGMVYAEGDQYVVLTEGGAAGTTASAGN